MGSVMGLDWLWIFAESNRLKFRDPVGCNELVLRQKQYKKKSGLVTKFV